jgi:hypothetical protein
MKKLCVFLCISQIIVAAPKGTSFEEPVPVVAHPRDDIEFARPRERNVGQVRPSRTKAVTFQLTDEDERNADRTYKQQSKVRRIQRTTDTLEHTREEAQQKARERAQKQAADKARNRVVTTEMTNDQQTKIENVKKGLNKLQEDETVKNVFKQLDMHNDFQKVMDEINSKADEQVTQSDLDSVQDFLTKLVSKKNKFQSIDQKIMNKFLNKLTQVLQQNFSELSSEELTQFLTQSSAMTAQALEPQAKKPVSKKSISGGTDGSFKQESISYHKPEKEEQRKSLGKGGMPSSHLDMLGFVVGLSLIAGIFVLMGTLANQS